MYIIGDSNSLPLPSLSLTPKRSIMMFTFHLAKLGLSVELFLDQDNYMLQKLSKNAGAKIVIHDPTLPPLPDEYGIDMQPNTASSVAIQTVSHEKCL